MTRKFFGAMLALAFATGGCSERELRRQSPSELAAPFATPSTPPASSTSEAQLSASPFPALPPEIRPVALAHEEPASVDHLGRVRGLEESGDLKGALAEARRAAYDHPGSEAPLREATRLAERTGERAVLKHALAALGSVRPKDALPLIRLAGLELEDGEAREALYSATIALARDPESAAAHHLRGRAELRLGMLEEAGRDFESAVILDPRHSHAFNNLGYVLLLAGAPERAIAPLARAVELAPHLAFMRNNLGVAYQRAGRPEDARAQFAAAADLEPGRAASLERVVEATASGGAAPDAPEAARGDADACARDPMRPGPRMTAHSLLFGRPSGDEVADCE